MLGELYCNLFTKHNFRKLFYALQLFREGGIRTSGETSIRNLIGSHPNNTCLSLKHGISAPIMRIKLFGKLWLWIYSHLRTHTVLERHHVGVVTPSDWWLGTASCWYVALEHLINVRNVNSAMKYCWQPQVTWPICDPWFIGTRSVDQQSKRQLWWPVETSSAAIVGVIVLLQIVKSKVRGFGWNRTPGILRNEALKFSHLTTFNTLEAKVKTSDRVLAFSLGSWARVNASVCSRVCSVRELLVDNFALTSCWSAEIVF